MKMHDCFTHLTPGVGHNLSINVQLNCLHIYSSLAINSYAPNGIFKTHWNIIESIILLGVLNIDGADPGGGGEWVLGVKSPPL